MRFYTGADDCTWIKVTALRDVPNVPEAFGAFVLYGNEDCPTMIELFGDANPDHDTLPVRVWIFNLDTDSYDPACVRCKAPAGAPHTALGVGCVLGIVIARDTIR